MRRGEGVGDPAIAHLSGTAYLSPSSGPEASLRPSANPGHRTRGPSRAPWPPPLPLKQSGSCSIMLPGDPSTRTVPQRPSSHAASGGPATRLVPAHRHEFFAKMPPRFRLAGAYTPNGRVPNTTHTVPPYTPNGQVYNTVCNYTPNGERQNTLHTVGYYTHGNTLGTVRNVMDLTPTLHRGVSSGPYSDNGPNAPNTPNGVFYVQTRPRIRVRAHARTPARPPHVSIIPLGPLGPLGSYSLKGSDITPPC